MFAANTKSSLVNRKPSALLTKWLGAAALVFTILVSVIQSSAQCLIDSASFVYLHPYFEGKNWRISASDSLDIILDSSACNLHPSAAAMVSTRTGTECIIADAAGSVSRIHFDFTRSVCSCCRPLLTSQPPVQIPLPAQSGIMYPLRKVGGIGDTMLLAVAATGSRVLVHHIRISTSAVLMTDTLLLSTPPAAPVISGIFGTSNTHAAGDSGMYVTGSSGVIRYFSLTGTTWGAEQNLDIANTQNVSTLGGSFAGTAAGRIYQRSGNAYMPVTQLVTSPIARISDKAAVTENGNLIIKNSPVWWNAYQTGMQNLRYFNLIKAGDGSAAELLDSAWRYARLRYADSATEISDISPPEVMVHLNAATSFDYNSHSPETLLVSLHDADSNWSVPRVYLGSGNTILSGLKDANPAAPCSVGIRYLAEPLLTVILRQDSVIASARNQIGTFDFTCYSCYWNRQTYRTGKPWNSSNTLTIATVNDSVRISYSIATHSAMAAQLPGTIPDISVKSLNGQLHLTLSSQLIAQVKAIRLFSADGRLLHSLNSFSPLSISSVDVSGLVCVQIMLRDGTTQTRIVPVLR